MLEQVLTCKLSTVHAGSYVKESCQRPLTYPGDNIQKIMTNSILGFIAAGFNVLIYKVHDDDDDDDDE
jgi:hypothetical protein